MIDGVYQSIIVFFMGYLVFQLLQVVERAGAVNAARG